MRVQMHNAILTESVIVDDVGTDIGLYLTTRQRDIHTLIFLDHSQVETLAGFLNAWLHDKEVTHDSDSHAASVPDVQREWPQR